MLNNHCNLCPRHCMVDRGTSSGFCSVCGEKIRVGCASLHIWEEPCISGENGSGTIFFAGCNLKCVYCQNFKLSRGDAGLDITYQQLAQIMITLQEKGAHNINLVTPTHYSDQIIKALVLAQKEGLYIPVVYNTSGYETIEAIHSLEKYVDVYLTDFKYADNALAQKYSGVSDYYEVAENALRTMIEQTGKPQFDRNGMLKRGVIVRHLVLPGQLENSKLVLKKVYSLFGDSVIFSIMNQYTPISGVAFEELKYTVCADEYDEIVRFARSIGITDAYIQDGQAQSESFIPTFNGEGVIL